MNILNALKGTTGEFEVGRVLEPPPSHAPLDLADGGLCNSEPLAKRGLAFARCADVKNRSLIELATYRSGAPVVRAVEKFVSRVSAGGLPPEIAESVIVAIAVAVRDLMVFAWRFSKKCTSDEAMHVPVFRLPSDRHVDTKVSVLLAARASRKNFSDRRSAFSTRGGNNALDATKIANCVVGRERYRFPNLIGIIRVSHSELILRCGQGRAALTRCFRPAFHSRFPLEIQGAMA